LFWLRLENGVLGAESVVLVNVSLALPGVREPDVGCVDGREVLDTLRDVASLGLELVVDDKDGELGLDAQALTLSLVLDLAELLLNVLLELADGVDEGGAGVVNLVNDEDAAAEQTTVGELVAKSREVDPLDTDNLAARNLLNLNESVRALSSNRA
jgi:hypothetical protein